MSPLLKPPRTDKGQMSPMTSYHRKGSYKILWKDESSSSYFFFFLLGCQHSQQAYTCYYYLFLIASYQASSKLAAIISFHFSFQYFSFPLSIVHKSNEQSEFNFFNLKFSNTLKIKFKIVLKLDRIFVTSSGKIQGKCPWPIISFHFFLDNVSETKTKHKTGQLL